MNLPTQHQIAVAGSAIAISATSVISTLGFVHLLNPADADNATAAISQIGDGFAKMMAGAGTLITIGTSVYMTVKSSPLASLFRASKTIAADPRLTEQVKVASLANKAPLVVLTDKLPEVASVSTTRTEAGSALANAVPSSTVQTVGSPITMTKVS